MSLRGRRTSLLAPDIKGEAARRCYRFRVADKPPGTGSGTGQAGRIFLLFRFRCRSPGFGRFRLPCNDCLPVQNRVPKQTLITAVQIAMHRVEVETDDMSFPHGHVQDRRPADQTLFSPPLSAYNKSFPIRIAPFHYHAAAVFGTIETSRAIRHTQPAPRDVIQRKVLSEDISVQGIAIRNRMVSAVECYPHMGSGRARSRTLRGSGGSGAA